MPVRDPETPLSLGPGDAGAIEASRGPALGREALWNTRANNHNSMFDKQGRVGSRPPYAASDNPLSGAPIIHHQELFREKGAHGQVAVFIRRR